MYSTSDQCEDRASELQDRTVIGVQPMRDILKRTREPALQKILEDILERDSGANKDPKSSRTNTLGRVSSL